MKVVHIEVGGIYGGSTRALELYLKHCDPSGLEHDVIFYRQTPRSEVFAGLAGQVCVLTPGDEGPAGSQNYAPHSALLALMRLLGPLRHQGAWRDFRAALRIASSWPELRQLRDMIVSGGYDVVHVNNTFTYQPSSILAASWAGKPVVAHIRNPVERTALTRWLAGHVSCLLSENQRFLDEARSLGVAGRVEPWYAGIEVSAPSKEEIQRVREEIAGPCPILIGSAGRLDEQKGYEHLIRAARLVVDQYHDVKFVVAGEGPQRPHLERVIQDLRLANHFQLLGFRSDVSAVLASCNLFVSSSLWEGLPLVILETMLLGTPVVATDAGGTREIVLPGNTGLLLPCSDPRALAEALCSLIADPERAHEYASHARTLAQTYTDLRARAERLDGILSGIARDSSTLPVRSAPRTAENSD